MYRHFQGKKLKKSLRNLGILTKLINIGIASELINYNNGLNRVILFCGLDPPPVYAQPKSLLQVEDATPRPECSW